MNVHTNRFYITGHTRFIRCDWIAPRRPYHRDCHRRGWAIYDGCTHRMCTHEKLWSHSHTTDCICREQIAMEPRCAWVANQSRRTASSSGNMVEIHPDNGNSLRVRQVIYNNIWHCARARDPIAEYMQLRHFYSYTGKVLSINANWMKCV